MVVGLFIAGTLGVREILLFRTSGSHCGGYEALLSTRFHASFLLALFLNPEDGGDMLLRKVG
jgi:hypothetical protein